MWPCRKGQPVREEEVTPSLLPLPKIACQLFQRSSSRAELSQCSAAFGDEVLRPAGGLINPEEGRISGLVAGSVLAGSLAKLLGRLRHVKDVVHDLECQAYIPAKAADGADCRGIPTRINATTHHAGCDERSGLGPVDVLEQFRARLDPFGL